jgi:L-rhamnose isomerase
MPLTALQIERAYVVALEQYGELGVDTDAAIERLRRVAISLQCWQGDDVRGFEGGEDEIGGGLAVTGRYPGRARNAHELRSDLETAFKLIPGRHRVNLHASYAEADGRRIERNELEQQHFSAWIDWAKDQGLGLDFNPTYFAHPLAADGRTLTHADPSIRRFWIEHGIACRRIGAAMGRETGSPCVTNVWIPDGSKDLPIDRQRPRQRLVESLDAIFAEKLDPDHNLDAVESKLFGIGSECYVAGSHEFYLGYALRRNVLLCIDSGHFHPTEVVADKISAVMTWLDRLLLHVSRGVRWDSDHVVLFSDEVRMLAQELVRGNYLERTHLALDYFDASINRVAAWVIGARNVQYALLAALLDPLARLRDLELAGDFTSRLALAEELHRLPLGAVWNFFCYREERPMGITWLDAVKEYEQRVLSKR